MSLAYQSLEVGSGTLVGMISPSDASYRWQKQQHQHHHHHHDEVSAVPSGISMYIKCHESADSKFCGNQSATPPASDSLGLECRSSPILAQIAAKVVAAGCSQSTSSSPSLECGSSPNLRHFGRQSEPGYLCPSPKLQPRQDFGSCIDEPRSRRTTTVGKFAKKKYDSSCSSSSSIGEDEDASDKDEEDEDEMEVVSGQQRGSLELLGALEQALPIKRGLSNHFSGKSKSFSCFSLLSDVKTMQELAKPDNPYAKKRRPFVLVNGGPQKPTLSRIPLRIGKKNSFGSRSNVNLALAVAMDAQEDVEEEDEEGEEEEEEREQLRREFHDKPLPEMGWGTDKINNKAPARSYSLFDLRKLGANISKHDSTSDWSDHGE